jgi:cyclophilin family peptidyl-prolyl cis-trans isomerase
VKVKLLILALLSVFAGICSAANPQVTLHITGAVTGDIVLEIYADKAPITAANFINYVRTGFYDDLIFHRVIKNFMIQGGGFDANFVKKTSGPMINNESYNRLSNLRGTIAMARTSEPHSATSEFFINHQDNLFLNFGYNNVVYDSYDEKTRKAYYLVGYCVFGKVLSGMNVVDAIAALSTSTQNTMTDVPVNDVIIHAAVTFDPGVCATYGQGDINGDCIVDLLDFMILAEHWLYGTIAADIDVDGKVNFDDFEILSSHWMAQNCVAPNWCAGADINKNGSVDTPDVIILAERWLNGA